MFIVQQLKKKIRKNVMPKETLTKYMYAKCMI